MPIIDPFLNIIKKYDKKYLAKIIGIIFELVKVE